MSKAFNLSTKNIYLICIYLTGMCILMDISLLLFFNVRYPFVSIIIVTITLSSLIVMSLASPSICASLLLVTAPLEKVSMHVSYPISFTLKLPLIFLIILVMSLIIKRSFTKTKLFTARLYWTTILLSGLMILSSYISPEEVRTSSIFFRIIMLLILICT
jgi:hypothetical protein